MQGRGRTAPKKVNVGALCDGETRAARAQCGPERLEVTEETAPESLVEALVDEVRNWMTKDLPVSVLRALRPGEISALRKRLARVIGGEEPWGDSSIADGGEGEDEE